jgi:hypothetical protein
MTRAMPAETPRSARSNHAQHRSISPSQGMHATVSTTVDRSLMNESLEPASTMPSMFSPRKRSTISALPARPSSRDEVEARADMSRPPERDEASVIEPRVCIAREPDASVSRPRVEAGASVTDESTLLAILDAPLRAGEPAAVGFARKEHDLREERRLSTPSEGDRLAAKFGCLTADRKLRLLKFLADARRRAAVTGRR